MFAVMVAAASVAAARAGYNERAWAARKAREGSWAGRACEHGEAGPGVAAEETGRVSVRAGRASVFVCVRVAAAPQPVDDARLEVRRRLGLRSPVCVSSVVAVGSPNATDAPSTSTTAAATPTQKVSPDGTCGGTAADWTCAGSAFGQCCSEYGFCGEAERFCGTGCQAAFGRCS